MLQSVAHNLIFRASEGIFTISLFIALFIGFNRVVAGCAMQGW